MITIILTAMVRKIIFAALIFGLFKLADNYYFKAFDTDELIKESPNAVAILLGMFFIALALA